MIKVRAKEVDVEVCEIRITGDSPEAMHTLLKLLGCIQDAEISIDREYTPAYRAALGRMGMVETGNDELAGPGCAVRMPGWSGTPSEGVQ